MTSSGENNGVQISGSARVSAGAIAGGPGAHISMGEARLTISEADLAELRNLLTSVAGQVRQSWNALEDPAGVGELVADAQQEAAREDPDMGRLSRLLHALMAGAGDVTALANAIASVQHVVRAFT